MDLATEIRLMIFEIFLLHPKKRRMDLFAFGDSPYAWLMEHSSGALVRYVDDIDDQQFRRNLWIPTRLNYKVKLARLQMVCRGGCYWLS